LTNPLVAGFLRGGILLSLTWVYFLTLEALVNPKKSIHVLVVDDHEILRTSLKQTLASFADLQTTGEAANGREALAACAETQPDVILMDMIMPEMDGIEAARQIRSEYPQIGIILWTFSSSPELDDKAHASGANRILTKTISSDDLANHIREVDHLKNGLAV
jgi:two-component system, NarL family, response regulator LiaR